MYNDDSSNPFNDPSYGQMNNNDHHSHKGFWTLLLGLFVFDRALYRYGHGNEGKVSAPGWYKTEVGDQIGRDYYWDGSKGWYPGEPQCPPWPFPGKPAYLGAPIYRG